MKSKHLHFHSLWLLSVYLVQLFTGTDEMRTCYYLEDSDTITSDLHLTFDQIIQQSQKNFNFPGKLKFDEWYFDQHG